ncbi:MAG TPA: calcium-binding protein [Acidimicrobiales bacterium]|nr:calcium-binding protein [Acidimicrobiales bacterium]
MATVFTTLVASLGVVTAPPVAAETPEDLNAAQAITSFLTDTLAGLADFDELGDAIPGTDLVPTSVPALDLLNVLQGLTNAITTLPDKTASAVEDELNGLANIGAVDVDIEVDIDTGAGTITFDTLELSRAVSTPIAFASGDPGTADFFSLEGGAYSGTVALDLASGDDPLVLALDTTTDVGALAGLVMPVPDTVFSADLELTGSFSARLGILDVTAAPQDSDPAASASLEVTVGWLDPDGSGTVTVDELLNAAPGDLFQASITGGEVHLDVGLSAGLTGLGGVSGTVTLDDTDVSNGVDAPDFQLGELGNFTNFTPQDVLAALAQLAVSMRGLQLKLGNLDLPLVDENLAELGNWSDRISKLFTDNGLAVSGNPVDLDITADQLETAGLETIEGIIAELEATLGLAAGDLGLAYHPADDTVTFTLSVTDDSFFHQAPEAAINVADELKKAGITGLVLDGGASLTIDPTYSLDLTVGLDLSDAMATPDPVTGLPPITDRIFIEITDGDELSLDVPISGDLDLKGTLGFLQLDLEAVDGPVDLLAPVDDTEPMLAVDLATTGDDRLTLTELFDMTGSVEVTNPGPGVFALTLGDVTITATANVGVPTFTMAASSSLPGLENVAGAELTFGWANLFVGEPTVTTTGSFDDSFLAFNLDNEDPLALFATILQGIEAVFGTLAQLDQQANDAGALMNEELPVVGTSLEDALAFIAEVREALNALSQDPAASVQQLELQANAVIAAALDKLDGTVDLVLPELPEPEDFVSVVDGDEVFDSQGYSDAVSQYLTDLQTFVNDSADFLGISYVPGNSPGTLKLDFDIGVCSDKTEYAGCVFELPITKPFNLDLGQYGGGLLGGETNGEVGVDYGVILSADFGIQLPDVAVNPSGLPTITGGPELFIYDTSGITADIEGYATGEMSATVGPFEVQVGDGTGIGEDACDDDVDDDADGKVNDGCDPVDISEATIDGACDDALDAEEDYVLDSDPDTDGNQTIPADGKVNDGCAATGNPFEARAGVTLSLTNDLGSAVRTNDFAAFFSGLTGDVTPSADCGSGAVLACADLPVYAGVGDPPTYLGSIAFSQADFDTAPSLTGADTVFENLKDEAQSFLWQLIGDGIVEFGNYVERSLSAEEYGAEIPVVGDLVDAGAEVGTAFNDNIATPIGTLVGDLSSAGDFDTVKGEIRDFFWTQIGPDGANLLLNADDVVDDADPTKATTPVKEEDIVVTLFCGEPAAECDAGAGDLFTDLVDVQVELKMGQVGGAATPAFDFGVPGLRLSGGDGTVSSTVTWQLNVGFGIGLTDGFYLLTDTSVDDLDGTDGSDAGDELTLSADVDLGEPIGSGGDASAVPDPADAALQGDIAFIGVDVFNAKDDRLDGGDDGRKGHEVHIELSVDIPDPGAGDTRLGLSELVTGLDPTDWDIQLAASIDLYVTLVTSIDLGSGDPAAIPRLLADLSLTWEITGDLTDGVDYGDLTVGFDNVRLDLGSFIAEFLNPVLSEIQKFTKPLQPIIDTLQAPIPGVAQLAELIGTDPPTLLDLMEAVADSDLTVIKRLLDVISFANALPTVQPGDTSLLVPLGGFDLDSSALAEPELPANKKGELISSADDPANVFESSQFGDLDSEFGEKFDESTGSEGGFSFPAFEEPSQLFGLIVGENPTLVRFDAGTLRAEVSQSFTFGPITVGPIPVSVVVSIGAAVEGRFAMGYDTKGIRQMVQNLTDDDTGNDGFFENLGVLFAGVFIDDLDAEGNDVPEIRLILEAAVGAAVDLVIVKAGVEAGVRATLDLNLHDGGFTNPIPPENLDGKLRIDEIIQFLAGNPICLFDVSGKLEAFIRLFVTIDLFLFSATFKQTIVNLVLLELDNITAELCEPPPPVLGAKDGNVLVLNMGERADQRNYDEGNKDEKFVVRQLSEGTSGVKVSVTAFGIVQEYEGIDKVVGSGFDGKDSITTEHGALSGTCQPDGTTVDPPIGIGCDGGTADTDDDADPGDTVTKLIPFSIPVSFCGGAGQDTLGGGTAADELIGDGKLSGADCVANDSGADDVDKVTGGSGDDDIWGDVGDDDLNGEAGDDEIWGGAGADQITGGIGRDQLRGEGEADLILGGPEEDPCPDDDRDLCSDAGDDEIWGGAGGDSIEGDHGKDEINGEADDDVVVAGLGDDTGHGGDGHDQLFGNQGEDTLHGDAGDDDLLGGDGDDDLHGGDDEDDIVGENGADTVDGGAGWDIVLGDVGLINRGPDPDPAGDAFNLADPNRPLVELTPSGGAAGDDLAGGADPDRIWGQEGDDDIHGNGGGDVIRGNTGEDTISGDEDGDELYGDEDDDTIHGDDPTGSHGASDGVDTARGGGGDDVIEGNAAGDKLYGDSGRDQIFGDAEDEATCGVDGADVIRGGPDSDHLFGNAGADQIFGEGGQDRIIGGSDTADVCDGGDTIAGGMHTDVIAGDNATIGDALVNGAPSSDDMLVTLLLDGEGAGDTVHGDGGDAAPADDRIFGQQGTDTLDGDGGDDYVEGNGDVDTISGGAGDDDLIGGSSAADGVIDDDRVGDGQADAGDTVNGDAGLDWIAGDNAIIVRNVPEPARAATRVPIELFDVGKVTATAPAAGTSGVDVIDGGTETDRIFGQGKGDTIAGGAGNDYVEGNDGDDAISGQAGDDDLIGGGSAIDGVIDDDRVGTDLRDAGETLVSGGAGVDWIAGDNAIIVRNIAAPTRAADRVPIELFDVQLAGGPARSPLASGGDFLRGDAGEDRIFGQGNGSQPATQLDPADGRNNDFMATGGDTTDPDFHRVTGTADEDGDAAGEWLGDVIWGGTGDDEIEGGHGGDLVFGNAPDGHPDTEVAGPDDDEDDIVGGGSADDGVIDGARLNVGANLLDGADVVHGDEGLADAGDDDVVLGDNGWIQRTGAVQSGDGPELDGSDEPIEVSIPVRTTQTGLAPPPGTFGDDHLLGNGGHDDLLGQAGDDALEGEWGSDGILGDLGTITVDLLGNGGPADACGEPHVIEPKEPFISEDACEPGTLFRRVVLERFDDTKAGVVEGDDVILGGDGDDWLHGGPGVDLMQGDGDGGTESTDPDTGLQSIADPNPGSADFDRIFGGDSNQAGETDDVQLGDGDNLWGGRGHDHLYGGHGADNHDVRPVPGDAEEPYPDTWFAWAAADVESYHGVDYIYGGHGPDAMQGNVADNGPVTGDRLMDWAGVFNLSLLCPATYGAYVTIRDMSPDLIEYWEESADADGVHQVTTPGSSGHRELAMVYKPDVKSNNNPPYPNTPGHFFACPE